MCHFFVVQTESLDYSNGLVDIALILPSGTTSIWVHYSYVWIFPIFTYFTYFYNKLYIQIILKPIPNSRLNLNLNFALDFASKSLQIRPKKSHPDEQFRKSPPRHFFNHIWAIFEIKPPPTCGSRRDLHIKGFDVTKCFFFNQKLSLFAKSSLFPYVLIVNPDLI